MAANPWEARSKDAAFTGVSDHGGWAVLVTVSRDATMLDRRRIELVDDALPALPHHHEGQLLPMEQAVALVERVRASAEEYAARAMDALQSALPQVVGIALRALPELPPSVAERITDYRARNVADWVLYRTALADAAEARGFKVHWYNAKTVLQSASRALHVDDYDAYFRAMRRSVGAPWNNDHRLAMAAAITALYP